jgi:endonuclease YncB( thermonuclease family)
MGEFNKKTLKGDRFRGKNKAGQPFGEKSNKFLAKMVLNKQVFIKGYEW